MNLRHRFAVSLIHRAADPALEWQGSTYTFGDIDARSNRMAHALAARGLERGDRLCVYLPNSLDFIDLFLACVKLGVIFVPINILYRERELSHILTDAEPKLYITENDLPALREAAGMQASEFPEVPLTADSPAALVYTSGTTGVSKGAILTHNNFYTNGAVLVDAWRITADDRFLLALPLFHVHALGNGIHCWLLSGCRTRLLERFEHEKATVEFLNFQPTLFFGVPTVYVRLLETQPHASREIGRRMRLFVSGSAPLPAQVLEDFRKLFDHTILERYGMTETLMNIANPYDGERRPGSVGFPLPGISVRVVDSEGRDVPDGETGEVYLKGPNLFAGYWRRDEATRNAFDGEWFKTGDLCIRSADGYHTLCGRRSDLIISGGFNIYPREIEEFLMEQPGVAEAAVAGEPHAVRGEVPVAFIVARDGAIDTAALEAACRANFASFKCPRRFEIVEKLPRNALGKVQKHLLQKAGQSA
ncbi:MAG: AMP-binding protein [Acidobacteriota bacterium]